MAQRAKPQAASNDTVSCYDDIVDAIRSEKADFASKHAKESVNDYMTRLMNAVAEDISDETYNTLSAAAKAWYDAAIDAAQAKQPLPICPGFEEKPAETTARRKAPAAEAKAETEAAKPATNGQAVGDNQFVDQNGVALKGLALVNAKRKAAKAAEQAQATSKTETKPAAPPSSNRTRLAKPVQTEQAEQAEPAKPAAQTGVHADLLKAVGPDFKTQSTDESLQDYLGRLFSAVNELDEDVWNAMPEPAQEWSNAAYNAEEAKKSYPVPEGYQPPQQPAGRRQRAQRQEAKPPAADGNVSRRRSRPAADKPRNTGQGRKRDGNGVVTKLIRIIVSHPNADNTELKSLRDEAGFEINDSTLGTVRTIARSTIRALQEAGQTKRNLVTD